MHADGLLCLSCPVFLAFYRRACVSKQINTLKIFPAFKPFDYLDIKILGQLLESYHGFECIFVIVDLCAKLF